MQNQELKTYIENLDNYDEKHPEIQNFMHKINRHLDYKALLDSFEWSNSYFEKLDDLLVQLSYQLQDSTIEEIRIFLREKIRSTPITTYNRIFKANIWNHYQYVLKYQYYAHCSGLSKNPEIIDILEENPEIINWSGLSSNPAAAKILKANSSSINLMYALNNPSMIELVTQFVTDCMEEGAPHKIDWSELSKNTHPDAIKLLCEYIDYVDWHILSMNPAAVDILKMNPTKVEWRSLASNESPKAIKLLVELAPYYKNDPFPGIYWGRVLSNPAAYDDIISPLLKNIDEHKGKIDFISLSKNPAAIPFLEANPQYIHWLHLSENPGACHLLKNRINEHGIDFVDWNNISENPGTTEIIRDHIDKINWERLVDNHYGYYSEKINHFNGLGFFQRSRLRL